MPRPWLKRLYFSGTQSTKQLAQAFDVSEAAIETRLSQIGISEPRPRCSRSSRDGSLQIFKGTGNPHYERPLHPAFAGGT